MLLALTEQLQDGIYSVTNISVEILLHIQIFLLVKAPFSLEVIERSSLIIKNEQTKQDWCFDETNEKSDSYCK